MLPTGAATPPSGVHLVAREDPGSIAVVWEADEGAGDGTLLLHDGTNERSILAQRTDLSSNPNDIFAAFITGLEPGKAYQYRILQSSEITQPIPFVLPSGDDVSLIAWGDQGAPGTESVDGDAPRRVLEGALREESDYLLLLGDLSYADGESWAWREYFRLLEPLASMRPLIAVPGNHEWEGDLDEFHSRLPSANTTWFSVRAGPVRVIALDSEHACEPTPDSHGDAPFYQDDCPAGPNLAQLGFLEETLTRAENEPDLDWIVVMHHYGVFSRGEHGSNHVLRDLWVPLYEKHGVDIVLQAHDHLYLRTHPIKNNEVDADGPTYIVAGTGGGQRYSAPHSDRTEWIALVEDDAHGFLRLDFLRHTIRGRFIDTNNETLDEWTIGRQANAPQTIPMLGAPWLLVVAALVPLLARPGHRHVDGH